jgi:hypothetical protein
MGVRDLTASCEATVRRKWKCDRASQRHHANASNYCRPFPAQPHSSRALSVPLCSLFPAVTRCSSPSSLFYVLLFVVVSKWRLKRISRDIRDPAFDPRRVFFSSAPKTYAGARVPHPTDVINLYPKLAGSRTAWRVLDAVLSAQSRVSVVTNNKLYLTIILIKRVTYLLLTDITVYCPLQCGHHSPVRRWGFRFSRRRVWTNSRPWSDSFVLSKFPHTTAVEKNGQWVRRTAKECATQNVTLQNIIGAFDVHMRAISVVYPLYLKGELEI